MAAIFADGILLDTLIRLYSKKQSRESLAGRRGNERDARKN